jgi:SAM-dependent methyltransferase
MASIYDHPGTYDLEHSGPQSDVAFFEQLVRMHRPTRILEYACGNGRLTIPVAKAAAEWGGAVTGLDVSAAMLQSAEKTEAAGLVQWHKSDVTSWQSDGKFDFVFSGCGSMSHLLSTEEQIAAWRNAFQSLVPGGRFVVAEPMPDYPTLSDSMRSPSRSALCLDGDFEDGDRRLLRCRAVQYRADLQRMKVRYFYDRFLEEDADRFVDDYDAHVFFPNELRLLFCLAGFQIEREWGDYEGGALNHRSRTQIICGLRRGEASCGGSGGQA